MGDEIVVMNYPFSAELDPELKISFFQPSFAGSWLRNAPEDIGLVGRRGRFKDEIKRTTQG
jgi:hypothetical protein